MSTQYQITRDKLFVIKQGNRILKICDEHAELDRKTCEFPCCCVTQKDMNKPCGFHPSGILNMNTIP